VTDIIQAPTASHVVYIPFVLVIGIVIGFVIGRKAGIKQGKAEFIGGNDEEV
jgi:hypothetical protein